MAKSKDQKKQIVEKVVQGFQTAKSAVFVNFSGLKVADINSLRQKCREEGVEYLVAKKTLMKIAGDAAKLPSFEPKQFSGEVATVFGYQDEVAPAKILYEFSKKHEQIKFVGGILEGKFVSGESIKIFAQLPSKQELYAKLAGTLQAPISGFVNVCAGVMRSFAQALGQIEEKKRTSV